MSRGGSTRFAALILAIAFTMAATPAMAAGFGIFEQGSKAMGMAGAFTAQADDGSALFHNVGGLAFQRERSIQVGTTLISLGDSQFEGLNPTPGASVTGEQASNLVTPSHIYYVQPIGQRMTFGFSFNNPFGLVTEWDNPDDWAGRFLSTRAELTTYDLAPTLAYQVTPTFGIGLSAVGRLAKVELDRRAARINPFLQRASEIAEVHLESDLNEGYGFNLGVLHKYNSSFSWGLSYRSKIKVDFEGDGRLTQVATGFPQFDGAVAAALPFGRDLPIETSVEFPDMASFGVAIALSPSMLLEVDANWTGWSSFDEVAIVFTENPTLSSTLPENWEDAYNYRIGFRWDLSSTGQLRLGYVYDETPQPEETVSPLLPDANRNGVTIGYGHKGNRFSFDGAIMYLQFDERTTRTNIDRFYGTYESNAWLLGLTASF
ncbi:MAG TPA: outer membrane protein transport protein [Thermoanaerobaculia bacterium]|nr:outer membrane protein transport protein [Thermoanaerobaculia bacterium]